MPTIFRGTKLLQAPSTLRRPNSCFNAVEPQHKVRGRVSISLKSSSALYADPLILYVASFAHGSNTFYYLDPIAGIIRGIAPTLLVERVAAGHACPDDSWKGSVMTSPLRFGQDKTEKTSLVYKLT
ncbi:hypothetical protein ARMGADRAFT_1081927 [Armillaria gallica]|uniref:Uncharacterized protein n=1 Tax=Armillaria gallica TaxID=47427 RepID=A0A2H3D7F3_ARMGA|nr:hypothetical protein ARMGADRAFT_1081927 [Armillaria gallica]